MLSRTLSANRARSKQFYSLAIGILALSSITVSAVAQEPAATPGGQAPGAAAPTPAQCGISGHHALLERMSQAFVLTCPQEQKLEPLLHDEESVSKPLLAFAAFTPEEKNDVMTQVKVAARKQIRPLLTPDQQAKMDQEIDTVGKGGEGLHKSGKKGGAKKETGPVDPFQAQDALCKAISNYSAFTDTEKKELILKVKQAALRPDAPAMTAEQTQEVKAEVQQR